MIQARCLISVDRYTVYKLPTPCRAEHAFVIAGIAPLSMWDPENAHEAAVAQDANRAQAYIQNLAIWAYPVGTDGSKAEKAVFIKQPFSDLIESDTQR
jgi:hypothetical protein